MKKGTTTHLISPRLMPLSSSLHGVCAEGVASDCLNLRVKTSSSTSALVPVGQPQPFTDSEYKPFFSFKHTDGEETVFMTAGNLLFVKKVGDACPFPVQLALLPSAPLCAVAMGDKVCIMTRIGPKWAKFEKDSGSWIYMDHMPEFPVIRLFAKGEREFSVSTHQRQLLGNYTHWSGRLNEADEMQLTTDLREAYIELHGDVSQSGYYLQPVVAKYQLLDVDGVVLFESAPVFISSSEGFQCVDSLTSSVAVGGGRYGDLNGFTISAKGYRIGVDVPNDFESQWKDVVSSVRVMVSPQLHLLDYGASSSYRLEGATATEGVLRAYIPGLAHEMVADTMRREEMVKAMIVNFESRADLLTIIHTPFSGVVAEGLTFKPLAVKDLKDDCRELSNVLLKRVALTAETGYNHFLMRAISLPHTFSATAVIATGDVVSWGGITPLRYGGYPIQMFARESSMGAWRANIKVSFSGGQETVVWRGEGTDDVPVSFSPLLSYPHPDATEMEITVSYPDGTVKSRKCALSPVGDVAVYLEKSFTPILLTEEKEAYVVPAVVPVTSFHAGTIVTSKLASPMTITSVLPLTQGQIVSITPVMRSSSAWDFARTHLYAFSTAGIYAVAINSSRKVVAAHVLDSRGVLSQNAVVNTGEMVVAIAGGDMVKVVGSRTETILAATMIRELGWNMCYRELWGVNDTGEVSVMTSGGIYRRDLKVKSVFTSSGGHMYLLSEGRLYDASVEEHGEKTEIYWQGRILSDEVVTAKMLRGTRQYRPVLISWQLFSSSAEVVLSLRGDNGVGETASSPLVKLKINGRLNAPVPARVVAPGRYALDVEVMGRVSADTGFESVQMLLSK